MKSQSTHQKSNKQHHFMDSESPLLLNDDAELWTVSTTLWFLLKYTTITLLLFFTVRYFYRRYTMNKKLTLYPRNLTDNESSQLATLKEKIDLLSREQLEESGNLFYDGKQYAMAIEVFILAIEKDASFCHEVVPTLLLRSEAYSKVGRHKHAYEDAEKCCRLRPDCAEALKRKHDTTRMLQFDDEIGDHDGDEHENSPNYPRLTDAELNQLTQIKEQLDSFSQEALNTIAQKHREHRRFATAIEVFTLALDKDAFCDAAAHILQERSVCYSAVGKDKEAYEDAGLACGIKPEEPPLFERRGDTARVVGEFEIALESYDEALQLSENFVAEEKVLEQLHLPDYRASVLAKKTELLELLRRKKLAAQELEQYVRRVSEITDADLLFQKACWLFCSGVMGSDMDRVRAGVKLGARLDATFLMSDLTELLSRSYSDDGCQTFSREKIEYSRKRLQSKEVLTIATLCTMHISHRTRRGLETSHGWQIEFLEYLLDVSDSQSFEIPFCLARYALLFNACLSNFGPGKKPPMYRKEVLRLIMKRFQSAKRFFLDSKATDKDFATSLFLTVLHSDPPTWDVQEVHDILKTFLLKFNVNPNDRWTYPVDQCKALFMRDDIIFDYSHREPIFSVVTKIGSPQIVQLLLEAGANPNTESTLTMAHMKVLDAALIMSFFSKTDCFRLVSSHGGTLTTEPLPQWILNKKRMLEQYSPFVQKQQAKYTTDAVLCDETDPKIYKEWIDTVFNQLIKQECSFLLYDDYEDAVFTPITLFLQPRMQVIEIAKIEAILKWNPKLMDVPSFPMSCSNWLSVTALGCALLMIRDTGDDTARIADLLKLLRLFLDYGALRHGYHWRFSTSGIIYGMMTHRPCFDCTIDQILDPNVERRLFVPSSSDLLPWEKRKRSKLQRFFADYDAEHQYDSNKKKRSNKR